MKVVEIKFIRTPEDMPDMLILIGKYDSGRCGMLMSGHCIYSSARVIAEKMGMRLTVKNCADRFDMAEEIENVKAE